MTWASPSAIVAAVASVGLSGYLVAITVGASVGDTFGIAAAGVGGLAVLALALLLGRPRAVGPAVGLLAAAYALSFIGAPPARGDAAAFGVGLFVAAELAFWSFDLRAPGVERRRLWFPNVGEVVAVAAGSLVVGYALTGMGRVAPAGGIALEAVGVGAAIGLAVLLGWLARSRLRPPANP